LYSRLYIVTFLLKCDARAYTETRGESGAYTPLELAIINNNLSLVEIFLNYPFIQENINRRNRLTGDTALTLAVKNNNFQMVELLLHKEANPKAPGGGNLTPLELAKNLSFNNIASLLERYSMISYYDDLYFSISRGYVQAAKILIEKYQLDVNMFNPYTGETMLTHAVKTGNPEMVKQLLRKNANPELKNAEKLTPLDIAKSLNHPQIIEMIENSIRYKRTYIKTELEISF